MCEINNNYQFILIENKAIPRCDIRASNIYIQKKCGNRNPISSRVKTRELK